MKVLSTLTPFTCKQVALGSTAICAVSALATLYFATQYGETHHQYAKENLSTELAYINESTRESIIPALKDPGQKLHISVLFLIIGTLFLIGAGLKETYNWVRS